MSSVQAATRLASERVDALNTLAAWFNTTGGVRAASAKKALATLVAEYGYTPWEGPVYRVISLPKGAKLPKVGSTVRLRIGLRNIQSWSASLKGSTVYTGYLGNMQAKVLFELADSALQLSNNRWLYKLTVSLAKDPELAKAAKSLLATIRKPGTADDEDEVLLELGSTAKVKILKVWPAFKLR